MRIGSLTISTPRLDTESGVQVADQIAMMSAAERPTAVFAANDLLAIGLLQGFVTGGLRVPEDIALIGYDDIIFAAAAAVPLSSIRQPRHLLGRRAAELLFAEVDALDQGLPHEHQHVRFVPELIVRRSTAGAGSGARPPTQSMTSEGAGQQLRLGSGNFGRSHCDCAQGLTRFNKCA